MRNGSLYGLLLILAVVTVTCWSYLDVTPIYDAGAYTECVHKALTSPFHIKNFDCIGHPAFIYMLLLVFPQYVDFGNIVALNAANLVLTLFSVCGFFLLVSVTCGKLMSTLDRLLLTAVYAFSPTLLAHVTFLNTDVGVALFGVWFLYCLLTDRLWWAALFGTCMVFTKETGFLLYPCAVFLYVFAVKWCWRTPFKENVRMLTRCAPLFLVFIAMLVYVALHWIVWTEYPLFFVSAPKIFQGMTDIWYSVFGYDFSDEALQVLFSHAFILNGQWIFSLVIMAGIVGILWKVIRGERWAIASSSSRRIVLLVGCFLVLFHWYTRFRGPSNPRYMITLLAI